jgi:DHA2 family multidrug resistance protein
MAKGATFFEARAQAVGLLNATIVKQTSMLSYLDSFYLIGACFVVTMPLMLFIRIKKRAANTPKPVLSDH